ncbi:MAG: YdcH family protein [Pseudomonadota bacterium]
MNVLIRERLEADHRRLDEAIERMLQRRWADPYELQQMKKQKLAIKDRLHRAVPFYRSEKQVA